MEVIEYVTGIVGILVGGGLVCGVSLGANSRCSHLSRLTKEETVASIGLGGSGKVEHCTIGQIKTNVNIKIIMANIVTDHCAHQSPGC